MQSANYPPLYQVNTRVWLAGLPRMGDRTAKRFTIVGYHVPADKVSLFSPMAVILMYWKFENGLGEDH